MTSQESSRLDTPLPPTLFLSLPLLCFSILSFACDWRHMGWDHATYGAIVYVVDQSANPYSPRAMAEVAEWTYGLTYPPLILPYLEVITQISYPILFVCMVIPAWFVSVRLLTGRWLSLYGLSLCLTAMSGFYLAAVSGNIEFVQFLLLASALYFLCKRNFTRSALLFAILSFVKPYPLLIVLFLMPLLPPQTRRRFFIFFCAGYVSLWILSFAFYPGLTQEYCIFLKHSLLGQGNRALVEDWRLWDGSLLAFFQFHLGENRFAAFVLYAFVNALVLGLILKWKKQDYLPFTPFSIGFVVLLGVFCFPRLKDYTLILAAPALLLLSETMRESHKSFLLFWACVIPSICYLIRRWYAVEYAQPFAALSFYQLLTLTILILWLGCLIRKGAGPCPGSSAKMRNS